ncbi:hypothetical protein [uncultured Umboniibacter sp.]|uniref:hypothetical protein n=1 Tax=uncultured Umboniibacter sp. TaxID=1798917 RepID=UPI002607879A|nr:hypothetical protein [uncultured Umboniibacter sp.]
MLIAIKLREYVENIKIESVFKNVNFWTLILPVLAFAIYSEMVASERFESRSMLTVQSSEQAAVDPVMMVMGMSAGSSSIQDAELVKAYVTSNDMLGLLDQEVALKSLYTNSDIDYFSRLDTNSTIEEFFDFYLSHIAVEVDTASGIITLTSQGFDQASAQQINEAIVRHAEAYINSISRGLAENKLRFMLEESDRTLADLKLEQERLLSFQNQHGLLDPLAEGMAFQQITYGLESQIAAVESQLLAAKQSMTASAPEVLILESQLVALQEQLRQERSRLSQIDESSPLSINLANATANGSSVSEVLTEYSELKLSHELALQTYSATQMSIAAATVETYRQAKYLVTLEQSTLPEGSKYPSVFYNVLLLFVVLLMLNGIVRIIVATVRELG